MADGRASHGIDVISRALLVHASFQGVSVPPALREDYIRSRVGRWVPFQDARWLAQWRGDSVSVFAWPAGSQSGKSVRQLPESLLLGHPVDDGAELVTTATGFEGRVWLKGLLAHTRWWPTEPDEGEWRRFLRGSGSLPSPRPSPIPFQLADRPWHMDGQGPGPLSWVRAVDAGVAAKLILLVAAIPLVWLSGAWLSSSAIEASKRSENEARAQGVAGLLEARASAESDAEMIDTIATRIRPIITQAEALHEASAILQPMGVRPVEWSFEEESLVIDIGSASGQLAAVVARLEESPLFESVEPDSNVSPRSTAVRMSLARDPTPPQGGDAP